METVLKKNFIILLLMCLIELSEEQAVFDLEQIDIFSPDGPIVKTTCIVTFPVGSTQHTIIWEYEGQQIAVNGTETDYISDRTYVQYAELGREKWKHSSILSIYGAVKNDERKGNYTCLAMYDIEDAQHIIKETIFMPILNYLPPPDYPKCSASESFVDDGGDVTFTCDPGDSNPPVILELVLEGPKGNETYLGNSSEIVTVLTLHNNNSLYTCRTMSDSFKLFMGECSFGPIFVSPLQVNRIPSTESSSTMSVTLKSEDSTSDIIRSPTTVSSDVSKDVHAYSMSTTKSQPNWSSPMRFSAIIIAGAVAGVVIIILLIIVICLLIKRKRTSVKPSTNTEHPMDNVYSTQAATPDPANPPSTTTESPNPTSNQDFSTQVYSEVDKEHIPNYVDAGSASNQPKKLRDQVSEKETDADQDIPVYAISSNPSESDEKSVGNDKMTNDMPIYSQVNKDSGMVENMIYEPAGPM